MSRASKKRHSHHNYTFLILAVILVLIGIGWFRYTRALPELVPQIMQSSAEADLIRSKPTPLQWPTGGESAIGALGYGVLASSGSQTRLPIASTAKLITALTVLQKYPLSPGQPGPTISLSNSDVDIYQHYLSLGGSVVTVNNGESISEYDMLEAMMLPSANNMADSLAIWAYGTMNNYVNASNQYIKGIGLTNTVVSTDASGFSPDTQSSANDLVLIGEKVMNVPVLAQIVSQASTSLPLAGVVYNVNYLLGTNGIIGIKTGNTDSAGGVYVFAAKHELDSSNSVTVVGSIVGMPNLKMALSSALPLLQSADSDFYVNQLFKAGQSIGYYRLPWNGHLIPIIVTKDVESVSWAFNKSLPVFSLRHILAPANKGKEVGSFSAQKDQQTEIVLGQSIPTYPWYWRIIRHKI